MIEKIQMAFLQAWSYCLRCLANISDDELSKRTKVDNTQFLGCNSSSVVCSVSGLMNHFNVGGRKLIPTKCILNGAFYISLKKCRSQRYTSNGSQKTKAAPKHTHKDRRLSEGFKYQVSRWPIFSIGQYQNENFDWVENYMICKH